MKKILPVFFIFYFLSSIIHHPVSADFERAYQDYLYQYDQYRISLTKFLMAKNRYLTYKTLTAQTETLEATKTFLQSRDQVLITYLQMLLERNPLESFRGLLGEEIVFFSDHKNLIPAIGSLADAVRISKTVEEHFPRTEVLARQIVVGLLLEKVRAFESRLANLEAGFEEKINSLKRENKDVVTLERWLLETKNKRLLAQDKLNEAQNLANNLKPKRSTNLSEEFGKIQVTIFEANQYLKEAAAYLKEIKEELKYGNY